jgi:hypothetical protein
MNYKQTGTMNPLMHDIKTQVWLKMKPAHTAELAKIIQEYTKNDARRMQGPETKRTAIISLRDEIYSSTRPDSKEVARFLLCTNWASFLEGMFESLKSM